MKNFVTLALGVLAPLLLFAQSPDWMESARWICGAEDVEALDEQEIERFEHFVRHPIPINSYTMDRLVQTGLLTSYQAAALMDYRESSGDVLSVEELALVDGFGRRTAIALAPFLSFEASRAAGVTGKMPLKYMLAAKGAVRNKDGFQNAWGAQFQLSSERVEVNLACRDTYTATGSPTFALTWNHRRGKVVLGDFHARYGQGLALWTGFSTGGVSGAASLSKRASGLSPSRSFSGLNTLRGIAADYACKRVVFSGFASFGLGGLNATWYGRHAQAGLTAMTGGSHAKISVEGRTCLRGTDLFGEICYDVAGNCPAALGGAVIPLGESGRLGLSGRWYHHRFDPSYAGALRTSTKVSDQCGLTFCFERGHFQSSLDLSSTQFSRQHQARLLVLFPLRLTERLEMNVRLGERLRNYDRTHRATLRTDLCLKGERLQATLRSEESYSQGFGWLGYLEGGHAGERLSLYLRLTAYHIDHWDDRIYCYERDAPGNFSVPAYYGRGIQASLSGGWKHRWGRSRLRIYLRLTSLGEAKSVIYWEF